MNLTIKRTVVKTPNASAIRFPFLFEVKISTKLRGDEAMSVSPRSFFSKPMRIRSLMSQPRLLRKADKRDERKKRIQEVVMKVVTRMARWMVSDDGIPRESIWFERKKVFWGSEKTRR